MIKQTISKKICICLLMLLSILGFGNLVQAGSIADLPDMGLLTPYATFGYNYNDSLVTIKGDSGISNNGKLSLAAPSAIDGDLYRGTGSSISGPGSVTGTTFLNQDLSAAQNQVFSASSALLLLSPNQTFNNVNSSMTFGTVNGKADVYVIDITGTLTSNISFVGDAGDYFVLNVNKMDLTGSDAIGSQELASHTFVNLYGSGNLGTVAHIDNVIDGTIFVPNATSATFHSENGAIYSGFGQITLMSGATVNYVPFQPPTVPEPGMMLLLGSGLAGLAAVYRKFKS